MTRLIHWGWILIAVLSLGWFGWHAHHLLLKFPPIWPDEALFADPAINLIHHGTMGTKLLAGLLPGIEQHTYWMTPGYFLFSSLVFWFAQPGLIPLRLSSLAVSLGVMALVYLLGRRSGLGRYLALFPIALLGIDQLYLRGSLVGRMDLLCLFFILLTLILLTGNSSKPHTKILTGIVASLALLIHPMGIVAPITTLLAWWQRHRSPRTLLWTCVGLALPLLLWGLYILQAPGDFWVQFGSQFMRKQGRPHLPFSIQGFLAKLHDYEIDRELIILWFLGLCGLLLSMGRSYWNLGLVLCQLMLLGLVLWGQEMWYFTYLAPLTFIGLAHWAQNSVMNDCHPERSEGSHDHHEILRLRLRMTMGIIPMILMFYYTVHFVKLNVRRTAAFHQEQVRLFREGTDYFVWAQKISDLLPVGSRVFVVSIPDPTFVLWSRPDLVLHNFVPGDVPVREDAYRQVMESSDYFVVSQPPPNEREAKFAEEHGELVATVGSPLKPSYVARIYKM